MEGELMGFSEFTGLLGLEEKLADDGRYGSGPWPDDPRERGGR